MKSTKEKVSYCIGLETGSLNLIFADADLQLLIDGFQDGLSSNTPKLSQDDIRSILVAFKGVRWKTSRSSS
jgi:hypothetical protein